MCTVTFASCVASNMFLIPSTRWASQRPGTGASVTRSPELVVTRRSRAVLSPSCRRLQEGGHVEAIALGMANKPNRHYQRFARFGPISRPCGARHSVDLLLPRPLRLGRPLPPARQRHPDAGRLPAHFRPDERFLAGFPRFPVKAPRQARSAPVPSVALVVRLSSVDLKQIKKGHMKDTVHAGTETRSPIRAIVGASAGNLVEWYDFYAYSFTSLYFASAFFPAGDRTTQLLNTAGIFAAGFLMRPVGGWLFGRIADRLGRRTSMMISVLVMCAGSLMVAVLPTYATVGATAPALLLVARLVQGLSVGGEVRHQRNVHERGGDCRPSRILRLLPVCDADRRTAAGRPGAGHPAAVSVAGATPGVGLEDPVRHRGAGGRGGALSPPLAGRDHFRRDAAGRRRGDAAWAVAV